jgi:hypothetical protein
MPISRRVTATLVTAFLISTAYVPALANSHDTQDVGTEMTDAVIPCGPLSKDAANKLPWFIKASDVECMNPTLDDLQASIEATSLLLNATADRAMPSSTAEAEYRDGVAAYTVGHYVEALAHLRAATPLSKSESR